MEDIAPGLLEEIRRLYQSGKDNSEVLQEISQMLQDGRITYADANRAAWEIGKALSNAYQTVLSSEVLPDGRMYYNIADRVVGSTLTEAYGDVADIAEQTQNILNRNAGIGLRAMRPELDPDKIKGIVDRLSSEAVFDDIKWILDSPVVAFCQKIVDESVKQNVDFQGKAGMEPRIIRKTAGRCCEWCRALAGTYKYPDVPQDVYRRHDNCNCTVEYDPGSGKKHQDVWSKKWKYEKDFDRIRERSQTGINSTDGVIWRRISREEYDLTLSKQQYLKHKEGTKQFEQYAADRIRKGKGMQGRLAISQEEAQDLIRQYAGKGKPYITKGGSVGNKEYVTADYVIGQYLTSDGEWKDTKRFAIYYGKRSSHIVPVKEDYSG